MIDSKTVEKLENSRVRLSVKIAKDEAKKEYDELLREYSKKAHIKGFRPGKAPAAVLEKNSETASGWKSPRSSSKKA
jgi:FKBP-type peptidyl-prolyl cis-trans isomerase (trigger factor)